MRPASPAVHARPWGEGLRAVLRALVVCAAFVPCAASASSQKADLFYEEAQIRFANREYSAAIIELKNALQQDPKHLPSHVLLGKVYLEEDLSQAAEHSLRTAQELGAAPSLTVLPMAEALLQQGRYEDVLALGAPDRFVSSVRPRLLTYFGHAHLELNDHEKAHAAFREAADLDPQDPAPHTGLAKLALSEHRLDEAVAAAERAVALGPGDARAWNMWASVSHVRGELRTAVERYARVLEIDPDYTDARAARIGALIDLKAHDVAAVDVAYLRENAPLDPRGAYLEALILKHGGEIEAARDALVAALSAVDSLEPTYLDAKPQLLMVAGLASHDLGDFEQSARFLTRYLTHQPESIGARKLLGQVHLRLGQYATAMTVLEPGLYSSPHDYRLLGLLASAYMGAGRHEDATPLLERALEYSGGNPEMRTKLAMSRLAAGEAELAQSELEAVFAENPSEMQAGITLIGMHLKRREFEPAVEVAKQLISQQPKNITVLNILGQAQIAAGLNRDARATLMTALSLDPGFEPATLNLAKLDILEGQYGVARRRLLPILEQPGAHRTVLMLLAHVEEGEGRISEAVRWLEKARTSDLEGVPAGIELADLYLRTGQSGKAIQAATQLEQIAPNDMRVLETVGRAYLAHGDKPLARVIFDRMSRIAGFDTESLLEIAAFQREANSLDDAIWSLKKALKGDPLSRPTKEALAQALLDTRRLDEALASAQALQKEHPDLEVGYRLIGDVAMLRGDYPQALAQYRTALERSPRSANLIVRIHNVHLATGETAKAVETLEQHLLEFPDDDLARGALAEAYLRTGELDKARRFYQRLIESHPQSAYLFNNLAHVLQLQGDPVGALRHAETANRLAPENPSISDTLGWFLVESGQAEKGLSYLRDAHSRAGDRPEIRYHIAVALARLGRREEARIELEHALDDGVDFDGRARAQALLDELR